MSLKWEQIQFVKEGITIELPRSKTDQGGFATESAKHGASMPAIQRHGRWKSTQTVLEYIEAGREFSDSAVNVLFTEDSC